jgi:hypothetical protein
LGISLSIELDPYHGSSPRINRGSFRGQLESLHCRISRLESNFDDEPSELKSDSAAPIAAPSPVPLVSPSKSLKEVKFPLQEPKSLTVIKLLSLINDRGSVMESIDGAICMDKCVAVDIGDEFYSNCSYQSSSSESS